MSVHNKDGIVNVTALIPERIRQQFKKNLSYDYPIPALEEKAKQLKFKDPKLLFCPCCEFFFIKEGKTPRLKEIKKCQIKLF
jgi:hypothetical protein